MLIEGVATVQLLSVSIHQRWLFHLQVFGVVLRHLRLWRLIEVLWTLFSLGLSIRRGYRIRMQLLLYALRCEKMAIILLLYNTLLITKLHLAAYSNKTPNLAWCHDVFSSLQREEVFIFHQCLFALLLRIHFVKVILLVYLYIL